MLIRTTALILLLSSLLAGACSATALLEVGPGKPYASLAAVPWNSLQPGDTVNIYYRSTPYYEKVLFSARGTASAPIHITGIPGPNGELPIIDGQNATTSSQFQYTYSGTQDRGLIVVSSNKNQLWGYKPGYVYFENLEMRNAFSSYGFTDGAGASHVYTDNAASIFVERGEHIVVHNCTIDGSGNGFFVASGASEEVVSRDITLENSNVYGNGVIGSDRQHNVYTEAIGVVMQYNHFGRPRQGAGGNNIKDRSAGTVIRYNWIEGGAHALDLVDAEDSPQVVSLDPSYRSTYVYSNIFLNATGDATRLIHYGGDSTVYTNYRKGCLYCYQNTFVIQCDQTSRWWTVLFQLDTNEESVDARNNIFFASSATPGVNATLLTLMDTNGAATFGVNWSSPSWTNARAGTGFAGTISGTSSFISNGSNNPGFTDLVGFDLSPASGSQCLDSSGALNGSVLPTYDVLCQYVRDQTSIVRPITGSAMDLGALESGAANTLTYQVTGNVSFNAAGLSGATVSAGSRSAVTDSAGNYVLTGLTAGSYSVSASKPGYIFGSTQAVNVGPNQSGINFVGSPAISSVTLTPSSVPGGDSSTGKVTIGGAAPANGLTIALASDNAVATVPPTVSIPAGATSASFTITTSSVTANATANISANVGGATQSSALAVTVPLSSLSLNPTTVVGGNSSTGTVTLKGPAPTGGSVVSLTSNSASAVVPVSVTVPGGSSSATFTITTSGVAAAASATITAALGSTSKSSALTINAAALKSITLNPTSLVGGSSSTGTVTLSGAATGNGLVITLASDNAGAVVPAAVTVNAGSSTATFTVTTSAVSAKVIANISGNDGTISKSAALTINAPALSLVSLNPTSVAGGVSSTGTVTLNGPAPSGGFTVNLSSNSLSANVPASVTVQAGATTATFTVTTSLVLSSTTATITATAGAVTKTATLTINPVTLSSLTLNPSTVVGGNNSTATVNLTGPAPLGGILITLSSSQKKVAQVPASVLVPEGASSATFTVTTKNTNVTKTSSISGKYSNKTVSATITVTK